MSTECSSIVWKRDFGNANRKVVAARLAEHADDEGRGIWPSVERVAAQCNLSDRTVQRVLAAFVQEGILRLVDEGGRGPRSTRRYDFDLAVVDRLPLAKWGACAPANKGDTVSPLAESKGDSLTPKGDSHDAKGCHGVTQTVIEPPIEPSPEREGASARGQREDEEGETNPSIEPDDRRRILRDFERARREWPTSLTDSRPEAERAWLALSPSEREAATAEAGRYVEASKAIGRKLVCSHAVYLREKRWEGLPPRAEPVQPQAELAKPFGPLWMAARLKKLMAGPSARPTPLTAFEAAMVAEGRADRDALEREKRAKSGWPEINRMHEEAAHGRGVTVSLALKALAERMVPVPVGSPVFSAWQVEHDRQGWPWLPGTGDQPVVYFPAGGPDALEAFGLAVADIQTRAVRQEAVSGAAANGDARI